MALVKRFGCRVFLCGLLGFATIGCGDDEDDAGGGGGWKCSDHPADGECGCYNVPPGEIYEDQTDGAVAVSSCPPYDACITYFDAFFEWDACSCGPSDMMPLDAMNIQPVSACPPG